MRINRSFKNLAAGLALGVAMLAMTFAARADKLYLKDGRVLDGEIVRQESSFVVFKVNGKAEMFEMADVIKVEKTEAAKPVAPDAPKTDAPKTDAPKTDAPKADAPAADKPKDDAKPADAAKTDGDKKGDRKTRALTGKPNRVAILNFGPPGDWQEKVGNEVGVVIAASSFEEALPLLEKDNVDTVVVRIRSGGGYGLEVDRFREVFRQYKTKFRLVGWVESAISAAAMSPWVISEFYMMPEGNIGACTGWSGNLVAVKGIELQQYLAKMEGISIEAGRDPKIMRAMQILDAPLSYSVDDNGNVTFFQDETSGKHLLNRRDHILTLNANEAVDCKFAVAKAATFDELCKAMGLKEYELAGTAASKYIDAYMIQAHKIDKQVGELSVQYRLALGAAQQLAGNGNDPRFATELGKAKQYLAQIHKWVGLNPNFRFHLAQGFGAELTEEWFTQQDELIRELALRNKQAGANKGNGGGTGGGGPGRLR